MNRFRRAWLWLFTDEDAIINRLYVFLGACIVFVLIFGALCLNGTIETRWSRADKLEHRIEQLERQR